MAGKILSGDAFTAVRNRNFRFFLGYRFFMTMATLMQSVIVSWHMYFLTKNVLWLGMIGLVEVLPQISIALFAGHYIDIWNRKRIVTNTTFLLLVGSLILMLYLPFESPLSASSRLAGGALRSNKEWAAFKRSSFRCAAPQIVCGRCLAAFVSSPS